MLRILFDFLAVAYALVALLLVLVILMQRSKQEGLGATFGSGVTDALFGAQTSSILVKGTSWLATMFFALAVILSFLSGRLASDHGTIQEKLRHPGSSAASPTSPAAAQKPAK
ncbi:Protein-export membrane protein SecG [Methylacidimicrobium cyclopophantes]|uniref:Protein-export membrane protein SecG n=1 Tax=Methylacidimicrobium cyclopophantes TaxID=1041766 RepID=A0A5E6MKL2_9BACT|nr:preprotein translocase subunit SecG [Methylacidimicrobium cyclopophantes]VVM08519.1 Protein-export membrane protein SecG [Methylacidimicrobium cyclopophantes]